MSIVGYAVPGPVVAMGVVLALVAVDDLLERGGLGLPGFAATGSFIALAYAYSIRFLAPGAASTVESGLTQVPDEVTASARSLGAPPRRCCAASTSRSRERACWRPPCWSASTRSKELPIAYLLRPVGFDTLPVWVYDLASESRFEQAALPALTIIAVALVPVAILSRHLDRRPAGDALTGRRCRDHVLELRAVRKAFGEPRGGRRRRPGGRPTTSSSPSSARAAAGSRRCCASSPASPTSTPARSASATTSSTTACRRVDPEDRHIGLVFQEHALFPHLTRRRQRHVRAARRLSTAERTRAVRRTGSTSSASPTTATATRTSCRAASASASRSPAPSPRDPG